MRNFIVYVNHPVDINIFKNDKRFHIHAVYYVKTGLMGVEYAFKCSASTIVGATKYIMAILKKERKKYEQLPEMPVSRNTFKK
jgi:hypothetical protein